MIHPLILPYIERRNTGAGFNRKVHILCRSGPHYMFDCIGLFTVSYRFGAKKWYVEAFSPSNQFINRLQAESFEDAFSSLAQAINAFYATTLQEAAREAKSAPPAH